ncbi:MAG: fasciclin domain-containing protein [Actinomycetia bacterium]|nr:fasciclin domain-containing protein [Actinomycetes bacterium]
MKQSKAMGFAALGLALALGTAACSSSDDSDASASPSATESVAAVTDTIPEVAAAAGDFTTLVDAVVAAGLDETLSTGEYTVFAPTDKAFQPLVDDGTVTALLEDPEGQLTQILLYHVVEGTVTSADLEDGQTVTTVQGEDLKVKVSDDGKVTLTDASGNTVNVVTADVEASNGVIHAIDGVLIPTS